MAITILSNNQISGIPEHVTNKLNPVSVTDRHTHLNPDKKNFINIDIAFDNTYDLKYIIKAIDMLGNFKNNSTITLSDNVINIMQIKEYRDNTYLLSIDEMRSIFTKLDVKFISIVSSKIVNNKFHVSNYHSYKEGNTNVSVTSTNTVKDILSVESLEMFSELRENAKSLIVDTLNNIPTNVRLEQSAKFPEALLMDDVSKDYDVSLLGNDIIVELFISLLTIGK